MLANIKIVIATAALVPWTQCDDDRNIETLQEGFQFTRSVEFRWRQTIETEFDDIGDLRGP
jgi:hypothetical protein